MAAVGFSFEPLRDVLLQAIVASLNSWPELHRRIFTEVHYGGKSAAEVARSLNKSPREVFGTLQHCERKLHRALRTFRNGSAPICRPKRPPRKCFMPPPVVAADSKKHPETTKISPGYALSANVAVASGSLFSD